MREPRTLRRRLTTTLIAFATVLSIVFSGLVFLVAYVVEDHFFASLLDLEAMHVVRAAAAGEQAVPRLPFVTLHDSWSQVPAEARLHAKSANAREVPGPEGRHYHLRRVTTVKGDRWLVAEVSPLLAVRPMRATMIQVLAPASATILLASILVAALIARRVAQPIMQLAQAVETGRPQSPGRFDVGAADEEVRILANALDATFTKLDALLQRERAFVGDVSHELRTPVAVIRSAAELLMRTELAPEARLQLMRILDATRAAEDVIELMLALAREEAAHEARADVHLLPFVEKLIVGHRRLMARDDVEVLLEIPPAARAFTPPAATAIVLSNLITNALVHGRTPLVIRSTDGGISVANARRLLAEDRPLARAGLGLDLVRRLCDATAMTFSVEESSDGTKAEVSFPRQ
jgi:signal transduction histidine kinase